MTPEDLRADIPVTAELHYLNTGASSPGPRRVVDAETEFLGHQAYFAPPNEGAFDCACRLLEDARASVAAFINADPHEVGLTESTGARIAAVVWAID